MREIEMGIDTKIILRGNVNVFTLVKFLESITVKRDDVHKARSKKVAGANITTTHLDPSEFLYINFDWKTFSDEINDNPFSPNYTVEVRNLAVFWNTADHNDIYDGEKTVVHMGCWGSSAEIARNIVEHFGGYYIIDDCNDEWIEVSAK